MKNVRIKQNAWQARVAAGVLKTKRVAVVIGNTIYLWGVTEDDFMRNKKWLRHELMHVHQFKKYGRLRFIVMYLWEVSYTATTTINLKSRQGMPKIKLGVKKSI